MEPKQKIFTVMESKQITETIMVPQQVTKTIQVPKQVTQTVEVPKQVGHEAIMRLLLEHNANPSAADKVGVIDSHATPALHFSSQTYLSNNLLKPLAKIH
jgi:hypothetical protein